LPFENSETLQKDRRREAHGSKKLRPMPHRSKTSSKRGKIKQRVPMDGRRTLVAQKGLRVGPVGGRQYPQGANKDFEKTSVACRRRPRGPKDKEWDTVDRRQAHWGHKGMQKGAQGAKIWPPGAQNHMKDAPLAEGRDSKNPKGFGEGCIDRRHRHQAPKRILRGAQGVKDIGPWNSTGLGWALSLKGRDLRSKI